MADIAQLAHDWARVPEAWEAALSKDGRWAAWTWTGPTEAGNVWLAPTDGSAPPRRLTEEADHIYVRSFSPDAKRLLLAQSEGSSEHDHLILLDLESGDQRLITPRQGDHYIFGGTFTPDGRSILYAASWDDETKSAIDGQRIYLHDLETGARRIISASESLSDVAPDLSESGRLVLYHRHERHPAGSQIWLLDLKTGEDREIFSAGDARKAYGSWIDEQRILVWAEAESHDRVGLLTLPALTLRWLVDDPVRSIDTAIVGADERSVAVLDYREGVLHATSLDLASGEERRIELPGFTLLPLEQLRSGPWLCERYSSRAPHEVVTFDPATGLMIELSRTAQHLSGAELRFAPAQSYRWRSTDGTEIAGWLYEPNGPSRGLIAHIHGGPTWHSEDWVNGSIQFLVAAGFIVLDPNYRGSTGYGRGFREVIKQDGWGGREQDDIRTGIESLIAAGKGMRGRVGIVGLSYGGYSSWFQITKSADLVNAAIPICGMYQLAIDYDETGMPHGRDYSEEMMGGTPREQPERYFNASPGNFIDRIKGRLMIVHGIQDTNVSPENTHAAVRDLDRAGIRYTLLTFDNEGHGIYRASNREILFRRMAEFFEDSFAGS
ncbi:MAG TPA: prolyl oligopeptidase family serine peptidase [Dongiaceae bacterium]|jgi:dipeptidyl aminopeptidase/acylaminoacyl peptidase|nr:prolyl oligopeptidase family serine peptidase [Dongiaceae bacterium]